MRALKDRATIYAKRLALVLCGAVVMAVLMGFRAVAQTDPPIRHSVAATSSLEGSSCQHPYRVFRNLRHWYPQTHLGGADGRSLSPSTNVSSHRIGASFGIDFSRSQGTATEPPQIINVHFVVGWWFIPQHGRVCKIRITFHGLPTYVNRNRNGWSLTFPFTKRSDRVKTIEITAAN